MSSTFLTEVRDTARQPARSMPPKKPAKPFAERMQLELQHKLRLLHIPVRSGTKAQYCARSAVR